MPKPTLPPSRTADQFVVRFPDGMREQIADEAKRNGRSMNAEIVGRIEDSFSNKGKIDDLVSALQGLLPAFERQEKVITSQQQLVKSLANFVNCVVSLPPTIDGEARQGIMEYTEQVTSRLSKDDLLEGITQSLELMKKEGNPLQLAINGFREREVQAGKPILTTETAAVPHNKKALK